MPGDLPPAGLSAGRYTDPFRKPEGVLYVMVNGEFALEKGVQTENRSGKYLLHK